MKKQILAILAAFACAMAEAEVVARVVTNKAGVPQIRVNGEVVRPRMFWGWRGDVLYDQVRLAASNGVDFVSFMAEKSAWRGENDYDWSELDAKCTAILNANPKALLSKATTPSPSAARGPRCHRAMARQPIPTR